MIKSLTFLFSSLILISSQLLAVEIVFEQKEVLGKDWERKLLTYDVSFQKSKAFPRKFSLTNAAGELVPVQSASEQASPAATVSLVYSQRLV